MSYVNRGLGFSLPGGDPFGKQAGAKASAEEAKAAADAEKARQQAKARIADARAKASARQAYAASFATWVPPAAALLALAAVGIGLAVASRRKR